MENSYSEFRMSSKVTKKSNSLIFAVPEAKKHILEKWNETSLLNVIEVVNNCQEYADKWGNIENYLQNFNWKNIQVSKSSK